MFSCSGQRARAAARMGHTQWRPPPEWGTRGGGSRSRRWNGSEGASGALARARAAVKRGDKCRRMRRTVKRGKNRLVQTRTVGCAVE